MPHRILPASEPMCWTLLLKVQQHLHDASHGLEGAAQREHIGPVDASDCGHRHMQARQVILFHTPLPWSTRLAQQQVAGSDAH